MTVKMPTPEIVMLMHLRGPFVPPKDHYIHHFTSQENLVNILKSGQLWMTRFDRMCNDHREGGYILELYHEALCDLLKNRLIDERFYEAVQKPPLNHKRVLLSRDGARVPCIPYVACFSGNDDDEHMRDYYADGKGGWIRFTAKIPHFGNDGGLPNNHFDDCMLLGFCPVEYDEAKVVDDLKKMIIDFYNLDYNNLGYIRECIGECLSARSLAVKSPTDDNGKSTKAENETRLIYFVPENGCLLAEMWGWMSPFEVIDDEHIALPDIFNSGRNTEMHFVFSNDVDVLKHIQSECEERQMYLTVEPHGNRGVVCCLVFY